VRIDRLSQQLAELHCSYLLESERQEKVLKLKWDLLNEMCSLFEVTAPVLGQGQAQHQNRQQTGPPCEDKASAAAQLAAWESTWYPGRTEQHADYLVITSVARTLLRLHQQLRTFDASKPCADYLSLPATSSWSRGPPTLGMGL